MEVLLQARVAVPQSRPQTRGCSCGQHRRMRLNNISRMDPTHTTTLRNRFAAEMTKRFRVLQREISTSIVQNDCFGLESLRPRPLLILAAIPSKAFAFDTSAAKVYSFMEWIRNEEEFTILGGPSRRVVGDKRWSDTYIESAYKKGMQRGDDELIKAGLKPDPRPGDFQYSIDAQFVQPVHADRVGLAYTRTFSELNGVTEAMDQQISRALAQGLAEGRGPAYIARQINDRVEKIGKVRARTIARTEVIRAHHVATVNMYREAGLEGVKVLAEWSIAGYNTCPDCADLEGRIFSLDAIEGLIPLHPNCRCISIPAGVGEKPSKTTKTERDAAIGEQYERRDGSTPKRGFYRDKTTRKKPARAK